MKLLITTVDGECYTIPNSTMVNFMKIINEKQVIGHLLYYNDEYKRKCAIFLEKVIHILEMEDNDDDLNQFVSDENLKKLGW